MSHDARHSRVPSHARCALTGESMPRRDLVDIDTVWPSLADRIRRDHPDL